MMSSAFRRFFGKQESLADKAMPRYPLSFHRILTALWGVGIAALFVVTQYPIRIGISRLLIVALSLWVWGLAMYVSRRKKWLAGTILAFGVMVVAFALSPGRSIDPNRLRAEYVRQLQRHEGATYVWGGENWLAMDCSGLVRLGLIDSYMKIAFATMNPAALRRGLDLWWHDCSARSLRDQYRNNAVPLFSAEAINDIAPALLKPGDIAVTSDGAHVLHILETTAGLRQIPAY